MEDLYAIRQELITFYKRYEWILLATFKFLIVLFLFLRLGTLSFHALSNGKIWMVSLLGAALSTVISPSVLLVFFIAAAGLFLSFASIELAACVTLVLFLIFLFYARIFPLKSILIPAMLLCYYFKMPYAAVLFAGLYFGVGGIIPVGIGVFLWNMAPMLTDLAKSAPKESFSLLGIPDVLMKMYTILDTYLSTNPQWVWEIFVFGGIVVLVWGISQWTGNYAKELAIVIGGGTAIFILLVTDILEYTSLGLLSILLGGLVSILAVEVIRFFEIVLDYSGATRVEFEDKDNYYYVKIVPKMLGDGELEKRSKRD